MTITIEEYRGQLYLDGVDRGVADYSISVLREGAGQYVRGSMQVDPEVALALTDAKIVQLSSDKREGLLDVDVKDIKGDGYVTFFVASKPEF